MTNRKKKASISKLRSSLYTVAKKLGWVTAFLKGPRALVRRFIRVKIGKEASKAMSKVMGK